MPYSVAGWVFGYPSSVGRTFVEEVHHLVRRLDSLQEVVPHR